jgi:rubrerythrin
MEAKHDNHGLSDLAYDWVTLVQNKAQALQAYDKYIEDARQAGSQECVELFQRIHEADKRHLEEAKRHLMMVLGGQMGGQQREMGGKMSDAAAMSAPAGRKGPATSTD